MFDDPRRSLGRLDRELKAEGPQQEDLAAEDDYFSADASWETDAYYEDDYRRDWKNRRREKRRSDGCGGLRFLAKLEILAIAGVIGWWILWYSGLL